MKPSAGRDFIVGLFVLAGLAAVAYLSLTVGPLAVVGDTRPRAAAPVSGRPCRRADQPSGAMQA